MGKSKQTVAKNSNFPDIYRPELINPVSRIKTKNENKLKRKAQRISFDHAAYAFEDDHSSLPIMRGSVKHIPTKRAKFRVTLRKVERPFKDDFEHQLAWICSSMGFFEPIDKDKNAAAMFKEIVLATERGEALSSTALAQRIGMSRGAVLNHLNNLQRSGLIEKNGKYYSARSRSMKRTIEEIEEDVERIFFQLKKAAEEIDKQTGFEEED